MLMILAITAAIGGFFFLHPYCTYPLTLRMFRKVPLFNIDEPSKPVSATLVFCAYNESAVMPSKLENLRRIRAIFPEIKFACYVDQSSDATLSILQAADELVEVTAANERTGKAVGMSLLAAAATTEIMIFTDANVMVKPESVGALLNYFCDPAIGGVAGRLVYVNENESEVARTSSTYWRLEEVIKRLETRSGSTMGADGSLFATRTALYPHVPAHLMDDFIVSMSVIFAGRRLISAYDVVAFEHAATASADEFRRKRRIACRAYSSHRYIAPQVGRMSPLNIYKYYSHRWVRWHGFPVGCLAAVLGVCWVALKVGPLIASIALLAAALTLWVGARLRLAGFRHAYEALKILYANSLGVADALLGRRYQVWQPPTSRD